MHPACTNAKAFATLSSSDTISPFSARISSETIYTEEIMLKNLSAFIFIILISASAFAQETTAVNSSDLTGIALPAGAVRVNEGHIPAEITQSLDKLVAAGEGKVRAGEREALAWTENYKRGNALAIAKKITTNLAASGWTYEVGAQDSELTVFTLTRTTPEKRALVGFYTFSDEAFVLAWTEMLVAGSTSVTKPAAYQNTGDVNTSRNSPAAGARLLEIPKGMTFGNVMGTEMPAMPKFTALAPKPGKVRGYVKDASGKPLAGATIGVRSTLIGGAYSGAQGKTDANGYYEFVVPRGVAHYYNAGYAIDYGDGIAGIGLHPADGQIDSFASVDGAVENFVLLSHGITSRANLSENPRLPATYYGGALFIGAYVVSADDASTYPTSIVENTVVEITLTPDGPLADGSAGKTIVVRKTIGFEGSYWINNIPVGRYRISAKLTGSSKALKMTYNGSNGSVFGMSPVESTSSATVLFKPSSAQASMMSPGSGSWDAVSISVSKQ